MRLNLLHIAIFLLLTASCGRNGVDVPFSEVHFAISLQQDAQPEAMRLILFDSASGRYAGDANLTGHLEGKVFKSATELRTGQYDGFCYDLDIPDTFIASGKDKSEFYLYTGQVSSDILARCGYAEGTSLHHTPDKVYGAVFTGISAGSGENAYSADAESMVETWSVEIKGTGLQYALAAGTVISGLPTTIHPYNAGADECGDLWTTLSIAGGMVKGSFNVFKGKGAEKQSLVLNILDSKGKAHLFPLDCTALMTEARRNGTMLISPKASINIPEPENAGSEGGFNPTLGDWNHQTGEIII